MTKTIESDRISLFRRMKQDGAESPQYTPSRVNSNKFESPSSSRLKLTQGRLRKHPKKNLSSAILQQRQTLRVIDNDVDVTPKLLVHPIYSSIDEKQITAFEAIGLSQTGSFGQLSNTSGWNTIKKSSSVIVRTSSVAGSSIEGDEVAFESLLSTQTDEYFLYSKERAPSQFYLPR